MFYLFLFILLLTFFKEHAILLLDFGKFISKSMFFHNIICEYYIASQM